MLPEPVRVGIVGAGQNTRARHITGLRKIEHVEIVSVCNRSGASSEKVAREFGIPTVYDRWRDLVAAGDTDAIVIGTWPYLHCPVTLMALEHNKHVLCESRMAMNARQAHLMLEVADDLPDLVTQIVPAPETLGVDQTIRRLIAEDYLGELLAIEVRTSAGFLDRESPLHWRQDHDLSGFNIMSLGIWYEEVMRWVGEATSVSAQGKTWVTTRPDESGARRAVRIPEHLNVMAEMACGALAHFRISAVAGLTGPAEAWLFGEKGTLMFREGKLFGGRRGDADLGPIEIPPEEAQLWRVEEEFIDAIRGVAPIRLTRFEDGVKYMEFTEAVHRSMANGCAVSLPLQSLTM